VGAKPGGNAKRDYLYYVCLGRRNHKLSPGEKCDLAYFRADHVDAAVWEWVKSFLTNPAALAEGLQAEQAGREEANRPLRERLAVVHDLLADNGRQLERALDLYLSGEFPNEMLTERKARLQETIESLERERVALAAQLEAQTLTDEQVTTLTEFAQKVAQGLDRADVSFEARRHVIELLDVKGTLAVEDGQKVVYARCMLGEDDLSIVPTVTASGWTPIQGQATDTFRIPPSW
jgi:uncharacterized protein (DUF1778 family)